MDEYFNLTANYSYYSTMDESNENSAKWMFYMTMLRSVCIPLIVVVGWFGNTLCLIVFLTKNMRKSSCSMFLASLAFADDIFLVCLLLMWIEGDIKNFITSTLSCQILFFCTYLSSFLNAWFIVGFTCERFIAICFPLRSSYTCSVYREKIAVIALCVAGSVMYSYSFWTIGIVEYNSEYKCTHHVEYFDFFSVVTWIDLFVTMLIPFMIIVCINTVVLRTVVKGTLAAKHQPLKRNKTNDRRGTIAEERLLFKDKRRPHIRLTGVQRSNSQVRVARTLFLVSTAFLFLNLPSHAIRLYHLIDTSAGNIHVSVEFYFFQELTLMLYYMTFSCNFVLYTLFGRNFKQSLILLLRCKSSADDHKKKMLHKLSSTQGGCVTSI